MKQVLLLLCFLSLVSCKINISTGDSPSEETLEMLDKKAILTVMKMQEIAWSQNDLEEFMEGYWKNDSLKFYGSRGLTRGWQQTLDNYKKGYPTADESGTLTFTIDDISKVADNSYWVMGQYFLKRKIGDANGVFMIIFKKIDGEWKIVADMSC